MSQEEYLKLVELANKYATAYYVDDSPLVTDDEYDKLNRELLMYEENNGAAPDSPTQRVGAIVTGFKKNKHIHPMWSMIDIFTEEELVAWLTKVNSTLYYCEPKFDGASANLLYENGILVKATTRGDGKIGEDILHNIKTIKSVPLSISIKDTVEIRGEIVISFKDFDEVNAARVKEGKQVFSNPRNAAAGSLRSLDPAECEKRNLSFYPWGVGEHSFNEESLYDIMSTIYKLGFLIPPHRTIVIGGYLQDKVKEIVKTYNTFIEMRKGMPVALDGMVIKVYDLAEQEELGYTSKTPRWMAAYKFPAIEKTTKINEVIVQVGRTGALTPVALVEPTNIEGVIVSRVTLHNFDEIERKDIRVNDEVILIRSGDVIPKITHVFKDRRDGTEIPVKAPTNCPSCNSEVEDSKCNNRKCGERVVFDILHYARRDSLDIKHLGESTVRALVDAKLVTSFVDVLKLSMEQLGGLEGYKDKKVLNLYNAIQNAKGIELHRLLSAIGIDHIGRTASKKLVDEFGYKVFGIGADVLMTVDGIGDAAAYSFVEYMEENKDYVNELVDILQPIVEKKLEIIKSNITGKTFVLTGSLSISRGEMVKRLVVYGAKVSSGLSKKTDYLLFGENAGSKLDKATSLGVTTLTEDDLNKLLGV